MKLWTCLATPGLPSEVKSGPALSVSLKSVSSVSLTVPPGCRQDEGFLEKGRLLPREVREWRKGKPSLFTSSSSSIINHSLSPLYSLLFSLLPLSLTLPLRSAGPCRTAGCQQTGTRALAQGERGRKAKSESRQLPRSAGVVGVELAAGQPRQLPVPRAVASSNIFTQAQTYIGKRNRHSTHERLITGKIAKRAKFTSFQLFRQKWQLLEE